MRTLAPGIAPPEESRTVPVTDAVPLCAAAVRGSSATVMTAVARNKLRIIDAQEEQRAGRRLRALECLGKCTRLTFDGWAYLLVGPRQK